MLSDVKKLEKGMVPGVSDSTWDKWHEHWPTPEYKKLSAQCSKNRLSEKGGPGSGPSRHTGGSMTHEEHGMRLENIESLQEQLSQPLPGSTEPRVVNETELYLQAIGGQVKGNVYGLSSQANLYYRHPGASTSTAPFTTSEDFQREVQRHVDERMSSVLSQIQGWMEAVLRSIGVSLPFSPSLFGVSSTTPPPPPPPSTTEHVTSASQPIDDLATGEEGGNAED